MKTEYLPLPPSYALARAQYMGWTFSIPTVNKYCDLGYRLRVEFTCVCGRREVFQHIAMDTRALRHVDVIRCLTEGGSFSRDHLLEDGYTEEQVRDIERKGEEFDRVTRVHWERELALARYRNYPLGAAP